MLSWLTGRSRSNLPEPTAIQAQKSRQIDQLKTFNQNVTEIQRDVEYRVNTVISGATLSLYITLPPLFPQEKPILKVAPRVTHPWVNDQMLVVGSPGINNFVVHSDLGKVVHEVVQEFQQHPPLLLPALDFGGGFPRVTSPSVGATTTVSASVPQPPRYTYPPQTFPTPSPATNPAPTMSTSNQPSVPSYISAMPVSMPQPYTSPNPGLPNFGIPDVSRSVLAQDQPALLSSSTLGGYVMPQVPADIPKLAELSQEELVELLENEDKLLQMIEVLPELQKVSSDRERLTQENEQLARQNLEFKPVLEEKKKLLLEKFDAFNDIKSRYDQNCQKQDAIRQRFDPRAIQDNLKVAALQAEEVSEGIAESFLEGAIPVDTFKKDFMEKRKLSHLRRAKEERLGQCLQKSVR